MIENRHRIFEKNKQKVAKVANATSITRLLRRFKPKKDRVKKTILHLGKLSITKSEQKLLGKLKGLCKITLLSL
jgi:hypothetical protein